ncbi:MAG TPA: hypothetical protein VJN18_24320 [Polyangiaceae bacterium]|nr:hypothetical protein [Polyangiaceae bacterium]
MRGPIRICVLVSSDDSFRQARARSRYLPLGAELSKIGAELEILPIGSIGHTHDLTHDVYIVSERYDTFPLLLAQYLRRSDKRIGIDLVEDHFSADVAGDPLAGWFSSMAEASDFLLCTTPSLKAAAEQHAPGLPSHVLGERYPPCDAATLALVLGDKLARFARGRRLTVAWLAMASHPLVPVDLADLGSFGEELTRLGAPGVAVQLEILTQGRVRADGFASLSRLGLPFEIYDWSEERYDALLRKSQVFFLPVDAQASRSSLPESQAIAALLSGSQVLATGYPLPARLSPFVYRDGQQLRDDLLAASPALRERNAAELAQLSRAAPLEDAASELLTFLRTVTRNEKTSRVATQGPVAAVLHGRNSPTSAHKHAQTLEALSVATPFALAKKWNFDVRFVPRPSGEGMDVLISQSQRSVLAPELHERLVPAEKILATSYSRIGLEEVLPDVVFDGLALAAIDDPAACAAAYGPVATLVERALKVLVPGISCFHSDNSSLPLRTA